MSFTCNGLGPVILWDGLLLSPEGKGGGGEGGASPPRGVLWLDARSVERGSKGKDAVEGGGPCSVRATYVPAMGQSKKKWWNGKNAGNRSETPQILETKFILFFQ